MKIISRIINTFVLTCFPCLLFSQMTLYPAYIINNQNDTVWGKGQVELFQKYCIFQQNNMAAPTKYSPDEIKSIRFIEGKNFVSRKIFKKKKGFQLFKRDTAGVKSESYFMEYLLDGKVDIFFLLTFDKRRYFIEKDGLPLSELEMIETLKEENGKKFIYVNPRLKGLLKLYMSDSPLICEKIDGFNFLGQGTLIDLSEEYHNNVCQNQECINYTKKLFWRKSKKKDNATN